MTVHELVERVLGDRKTAWANVDPQLPILATGRLNSEDELAVRRIVAAAGYEGSELEDLVGQVSTRLVGHVQALADTLPAAGGD